MDETYDVVVIGGGAAGLSGAVALARSRRSVLVVDAADPRNAPAAHVHNFLTRNGASPSEIHAIGCDEVTNYGGRVEAGRVTSVHRDGDRFRVEIAGDRTVGARRILAATGVRDELPDVAGLAERWGTDVLHCPYCHGWEVRDRRLGVLATGSMAVHQAVLFRQLSPHVVLLQHIGPTPNDEQREQLHALGIRVLDGTVVRVDAAETGLIGVHLADGSRIELDALVVAPRCIARAELLAPLGLQPVEVRLGDHVLGTRVEADAAGATAVAGVWVAGNVADIQAQVVTAAASGLAAGAAINTDLLAEQTRDAVRAHRDEQIYGEQAWDERYRSQPQTWSGNPNPVLVAEIAGLRPGTALDAGSGEGADACWLATRGWQVTGVDLSTTAIDRAAAQAKELDLDIAWRHLDLTRVPAPGTFDLVSSHFLHLPVAPRRTLFSHLAAAVAPGGTLLIVGHDPTDAHTTMPRHQLAETGWIADEVAATLGDGWTVQVAEARPRPAIDPEGRDITIHDAVLRARRDPP